MNERTTSPGLEPDAAAPGNATAMMANLGHLRRLIEMMSARLSRAENDIATLTTQVSTTHDLITSLLGEVLATKDRIAHVERQIDNMI